MRPHEIKDGVWVIAKNFQRVATNPGGAGLESRDCDSVQIFDSWGERYGWGDQQGLATTFSTREEALAVMQTLTE